MKNLKEVINLIKELDTDEEIDKFLPEFFTLSELQTFSKRWSILQMLKDGQTQRQIAETLGVSLCKVTRGSKVLKNENSVITRYLNK